MGVRSKGWSVHVARPWVVPELTMPGPRQCCSPTTTSATRVRARDTSSAVMEAAFAPSTSPASTRHSNWTTSATTPGSASRVAPSRSVLGVRPQPRDALFDSVSRILQNPPARPPRGFFRELIYKIDCENPKAFQLTNDIKSLYKNGEPGGAHPSERSTDSACRPSVVIGPTGDYLDTNEHRIPSKITWVLWLHVAPACASLLTLLVSSQRPTGGSRWLPRQGQDGPRHCLLQLLGDGFASQAAPHHLVRLLRSKLAL